MGEEGSNKATQFHKMHPGTLKKQAQSLQNEKKKKITL